MAKRCRRSSRTFSTTHWSFRSTTVTTATPCGDSSPVRASTLATSPATGLLSSVSAWAACTSATTPATWRAWALAADRSSLRAPARARSYWALAASAWSREALKLASASSRFCAATRPSRARPSTRLKVDSARSAAATARCQFRRAISTSCGRAPLSALAATAWAASWAAVACASLALTSGLSMRIRGAPTAIWSPSFTRICAMRAVTLGAMSASCASIWPWNTSGAGCEAFHRPKPTKPATATKATVPTAIFVVLLLMVFALSSQ